MPCVLRVLLMKVEVGWMLLMPAAATQKCSRFCTKNSGARIRGKHTGAQPGRVMRNSGYQQRHENTA